MQGAKSDQDQAARLIDALRNGFGLANVSSIYLEVFFTDKLEARQRLVTKAFEKSDPALCRLPRNGKASACWPFVERRKAVACRNRTAALLTIADAVISRYQRAKDRRGLLDYDDLIDKALALLGEDRAAWVHYKLDQGIDHVLIDEAQDTSPKQWEIIRLLTG